MENFHDSYLDNNSCNIINNFFPISEVRENEQYFFSENVISNLVETLNYEKEIICLGTPAVAHGFWELKGRNVLCLDIDERFNYLPGYKNFDILNPSNDVTVKPDVIVIDPPFFKINLNDMYNCVEKLTNGDKKTKILFVYVQREDRALLNIFKSYNLQLTRFKMEYRYVDASKWSNYSLYSNCEFSKIKFSNKLNNSKNLNKSIKKAKDK